MTYEPGSVLDQFLRGNQNSRELVVSPPLVGTNELIVMRKMQSQHPRAFDTLSDLEAACPITRKTIGLVVAELRTKGLVAEHAYGLTSLGLSVLHGLDYKDINTSR